MEVNKSIKSTDNTKAIKLIRQPNRVTMAKYDFNLRQQRVFVNIIDKLQVLMKDLESGKSFNQLSLFDKDKLVFGLELRSLTNDRTSYNKLKLEIAAMSGIAISFPTTDPLTGKPAIKHTNLFSTYISELNNTAYDRLVTIEIEQEVAKILLDGSKLAGGYTRFSKLIVESCTNKYTHKIYVLLCKWRDKDMYRMKISELRDYLVLDNKYPDIRDLKKWIIEPVHKELKEGISDVFFEYSFTKDENNKVSTINFIIKLRKTIEEEELIYIENKNFIYSMLSNEFRFTPKDFEQIASVLNIDNWRTIVPQIIKLLDRVADSIKTDARNEIKKIADPKAYIIKSICSLG